MGESEKISEDQAREALGLLQKYIMQRRAEIGLMAASISEAETVFQLDSEYPLESMNLSVRAYNAIKGLLRNPTLDDLANLSASSLLSRRAVGPKTIREIREVFERYGLSLKP